MIINFEHKGLKEFFEAGKSKKVPQAHAKKIKRILAVMNKAAAIQDVNIPSFRLHKYKGKKDVYSVDVNGNFRILFRWNGKSALDVDFLDPH